MDSPTSFRWVLTVFAALAAVLTACELPLRGTGVDNPVAQVIVSPDTLTIDPLQTHQFRAFGRTQVGDSVPVSVGWAASAGAITQDGIYTADTSAVDVTVTATLSSSAVSGRASVRKRRVIEIVISPTNVTVLAGAVEQFTVFGHRNTGDSVGVAATYDATGGTISASGAYTAGPTPGNYRVIARQNGGSLRDTSAVTVTSVPVASVTVAPSTASLLVGATQQLSATLKDAAGNTLTGRSITWSSSSPSIATVTSSGLVTAVAAGSATVTATSEGQSGTAAITVTVVPVASVTVSPASASVTVGQTQQLTATPRDASGNSLTGRVVTWASNAPAVATVNSSGLVTAVAAGSATITATSEGRSGTATITVSSLPTRAGYYVSPSGSPSGNGSAAQPWDVATALAGPAAVQPGDTIWLRAGIYSGAFTSALSGTSSAPLIVRQYPGERATINGTLSIQGGYTWYWGFEVANSNTATQNIIGVNVGAPGVRIINLVVHDHSGNGLGVWSQAPDAEVYGTIVYNNGFRGSTSTSFGHGIYSQNQTGTKRFEDNILFNQFGYGFHIYGSSAAFLRSFQLEGNVIFNSGAVRGSGQPNILVGGGAPAEGIVIRDNMTYHQQPSAGTVWVGWDGTQSADLQVQNNHFAGGWPVLRIYGWNQATVSGNIMYGPGGSGNGSIVDQKGTTSGYQWSTNTYYVDPLQTAWLWSGTGYTFPAWRLATGFGTTDTLPAARPSGFWVFVRPNRYELGRGHIIVYNWDRQSSVAVDVTPILQPGDLYQVRNVQDPFGAPVASGTYGGGLLTLPLTAVQPPTPIGGWGSVTPPVTGPDFNVFVVVRPGT